MAKKEATLVLKITQKGKAAFQNIGAGLKSVAGLALKAGAGLLALGAGMTHLVGKADEFKSVEKSFQSLAASQGKDADKMLSKMRELSQGQISDLKLMQNANNALLLGLPVDKFGDMLTIARGASKATGESMEFMLKSITTGLGRGSKMILDNLGILVDTNKAYETFAQKVGKASSALTEAEKKQAFINEAMRVGLENNAKLGEQNLTTSEAVEQLKVQMENLVPVLGDALRPVLNSILPMVKSFAETIGSLARSDELHEWLNNGVAGFVLFKGIVNGVISSVIGGFGALGSGMAQLVSGQFSSAVDTFKGIGSEITQPFKEAMEKTGTEVDAIDAKFAANRQARREEERESIAEDLALKAEMNQIAEEEKAINDEVNKLAEQDRKSLHEEAMSMLERNGQLQRLNNEILNAKTMEQKRKAVMAKQKAVKAAEDQAEKNRQTAMFKFDQFLQSEKIKSLQGFLSHASSLQNAKSKELVLIGKLAAAAQITISTAQAAMSGFKWGMEYGGPAGPALAASFAGIAVAAGAVQLANVAGVQLAEGGVVRATQGGVNATIGEGGQDEAVIPLDDEEAQEKLGGGGVTINVMGGLLGNEAEAHEFAVAVDRELAELRRNNESVAFDEELT